MSPERRPDANALRRRIGHWRLYAAVTGSAMAAATNASAGPQDLAALNTPLIHAAAFGSGTRTAATKAAAPTIAAVYPAGSEVGIIQPGEWVSIYGANLASATAVWNGNFPTSLGGTAVQINGRPAFLSFVSPGQINLQAPDDTATGVVSVVVTTSAGSAKAMVTLAQYSPSFLLVDASHVSGIIVRADGSGAYGKGSYDILGPTGNCLGYPTTAAKPGDLVELYGVGFGPTTPTVAAGTAYSGAAPLKSALSLSLNNVPVQPSFVGLSSAGVYQINLVLPGGLGQGDIAIQASVGGMFTQKGLLFSLQTASAQVPGCTNTGDGGYGYGVGDGGYGGDGGFIGDGGTGGTGDGGTGTGDGGMSGGGTGDGGTSGGGGDGGSGGDGGDGDGDGG